MNNTFNVSLLNIISSCIQNNASCNLPYFLQSSIIEMFIRQLNNIPFTSCMLIFILFALMRLYFKLNNNNEQIEFLQEQINNLSADVEEISDAFWEDDYKEQLDNSSDDKEQLDNSSNSLKINSYVDTKEMPNNETSDSIKIDPFMDPANERTSLFPIQDPIMYEMYNKILATHWVVNEIDLSQDNWKELKPDEQYYLKHVLGFFSASDVIVNSNFDTNFMEHVTLFELKMFYHAQVAQEDIHTTMYNQLIEVYISDPVERETIKQADINFPAVARKKEWVEKYIRHGSMVERLIAFAIMEGIFFSSSFAAIYWIRRRGIMPGLTHANSFIVRDESLHRDAAIYVYNKHVVNKLPVAQIEQMICEGVALEIEFCCESLPVNLIGMNSNKMAEYVKFIADGLAYNLIDKTIFNVENPFDWMDLIALPSKANFFEHRGVEYAKFTTLNSAEDNTLSFDAEY
jgi:ribonucleoside-diphosphate reductase beta chain